MNDGWLCVVCGLGLAPDVKTCDHGGGFSGFGAVLPVLPVTPTVYNQCGNASATYTTTSLSNGAFSVQVWSKDA